MDSRVCAFVAYGLICLKLTFFSIAPSANAAPLTFDFGGVVERNTFGKLFPGKSVGDSCSGTFTVDPSAPVTFTWPGVQNYEGGFFNVTFEGQSLQVLEFNLWYDMDIEDGVEFDIALPNDSLSPTPTGSLSLRSSANLYETPGVPTSYDINVFNVLARINLYDPAPFSINVDVCSVNTITLRVPEPNFPTLAIFALCLAMCRRKLK